MSSQDSSPMTSPIPPPPSPMPPPSPVPTPSPYRYPCPPPSYLNYHPYPYRRNETNLLDPWGSDYPGESPSQGSFRKPPRKRKLERKTALPSRKSYLRRFLADPNAAVIPPTWSPPQKQEEYQTVCYQSHEQNICDGPTVAYDANILAYTTGNDSCDSTNVSYEPTICFEVNSSGELVRKYNTPGQSSNIVDNAATLSPLSSATNIVSQYSVSPETCVSQEPSSDWNNSQVQNGTEICSLVNDPNVLIQWNGTAGPNQWDNTSNQSSTEEVSSTVSFSFLTSDYDEISVSYPKLCLQTDSSQEEVSQDTMHVSWSSDHAEHMSFYVQELQDSTFLQESVSTQEQTTMVPCIIDQFFTDSLDSCQNEPLLVKVEDVDKEQSDSLPAHVDCIQEQIKELPDMPSLGFSP